MDKSIDCYQVIAINTDKYIDLEKLVIRAYRGFHYRWIGWVEGMEKAKPQRSMSKKVCSPENTSCEGFFARLKMKCFIDIHGLELQLISLQNNQMNILNGILKK